MKLKNVFFYLLSAVITVVLVMQLRLVVEKNHQPSLTFIGHASVKIKSSDGKVIYIDPYYPVGDYREPADYILVTHSHHDHNNIGLCKQKEGCKIIRWSDAIVNHEYQTFEYDSVKIEAVPSGGHGIHNVWNNAGYLVTVDNVSVLHEGDTSMNDDKYTIAKRQIDYAMYPIDGSYNMGPDEASEVANLIGAKHNIPIHGNGDHFSEQRSQFWADGKLPMRIGQTIYLYH